MTFDFKNPDYIPIFAARARRLEWIRDEPSRASLLLAYYRDNIADFINDWGTTYDPRLVERDLPPVVPFLLFPRQRQWVEWCVDSWRNGRPGVSPKSRDMGLSWLAVATAAGLCITHEGFGVGFGSRKEEYVDKSGSPKALFWKAREFIKRLPREFRGGCDVTVNAPHLRIGFPGTGSSITGEAGDNIGRGDRQSIYFVDEAAYLERPALTEAALSATTNCQIDISSANGMGNPFAQKVHSWPEAQIFRLHWRDDPRKDDEWYARQEARLDPVTVAQEIDINFAASATGILIQPGWVQAAINAHIKLGIAITGRRMAAMDVADGGQDKNALCVARGILIESVESWQGGKDDEGDIYKSVEHVFARGDELGFDEWFYDADGMGAGVRGDARVINQGRDRKQIVKPFRGSGKVHDPERQIPTAAPKDTIGRDNIERINEDFFHNAKAQAWYSLRLRFLRTSRAVKAVEAGEPNPYDPDDLISIDGAMPADQLRQLTIELSQPTRTNGPTGKMVIDKSPEGTKSPNLADAVMIRFAPRKMGSFWTA